MDVPIESQRLIYAEGLTEPKDVLELVGTWQIEAALSAVFFNNRESMKKDVLSMSAQQYLKNCKIDPTYHTALIC